MAEMARSDSPEGSAVSSGLSHSVVTSDECSRSTGDDFDDQPSPAELSDLYKESTLPLDKLLSVYGGHLQCAISCTYESSTPGDCGILFETLSPSSSSDDKDEEYLPENDSSWHQNVPVGDAHQAVIPDVHHRHNLTLGNSGDEHLLWDPSKLPQSTVEKYCVDVARHSCIHTVDGKNVSKAVENGPCVHDDEQALYLLLQCNYNVDEALRRHQLQVIPPTDPLSLWSDEERTNFVAGLKLYGKDFYMIQQNKVRTRSVGELVHVYYLWKKTNQYATFTGKPYNFRRQTLQIPSIGSLEDVSISAFHPDSSSPSADWNLHTGELDSMYLEKCLPMTHVMSPWLSPQDCDAVLDTVYCHDLSHSHCGVTYPPAVYVNCFDDEYHFPQCCVECRHVSSSQGFSSSATDSPNVGRGVSGELPGAARAALYFPSSPAEDTDPYTLLTQTSNSMSNRNLAVHACNAGKMLAQ